MKDTDRKIKVENKTSRTLRTINIVFIFIGLLIAGTLVKLVIISPVPKNLYKYFTSSQKTVTVIPSRGNILSRDGRLLATTIPEYDIYMDCKILAKEYKSPEFKEKIYRKNGWPASEQEWMVASRALSQGLASTLGRKSADEYFSIIEKNRHAPRGGRKVLIAKKVDHETYLKLKKLPLWKYGANIGGMIDTCCYNRRYPYDLLGRRVIGYCKDNSDKGKKIGLEGSFDDKLHGKDGKKVLKSVDERGVMVQDFSRRNKKAKDGFDIRTTLDVDLQDVCDESMREFFAQYSAVEEGCVIVMETSTGAIRAMVNLKRDSEGNVGETYNYALLDAHDPGSVFKTVTTMCVLEDGFVKSLEDSIPCFDGKWIYRNHELPWDKHTAIKYCPEQKMTIRRGLQESSNHVFRYLAGTYYGARPEKYIAHLEKFHLTDSFEDFDISGVAKPGHVSVESIKNPNNATMLPLLGMGYGARITTLHLITFYNAIANGGRMMKPYLVESIERDGRKIEKRSPQLLDVICSKSTADTLTNGLRAVCQRKTCENGGFDGTGYWAFRGTPYTMAGKTGTCFVSQGRHGYTVDGASENNSVFVGFFPADDPQYTVLAGVHTHLARNNVEGAACGRVVRKVTDWLWYSGVECTRMGKTKVIMK